MCILTLTSYSDTFHHCHHLYTHTPTVITLIITCTHIPYYLATCNTSVDVSGVYKGYLKEQMQTMIDPSMKWVTHSLTHSTVVKNQTWRRTRMNSCFPLFCKCSIHEAGVKMLKEISRLYYDATQDMQAVTDDPQTFYKRRQRWKETLASWNTMQEP